MAPTRAAPEGPGSLARRPPGDIVLIVDDVPASLGALCLDLEGDGYDVLVASDGAAALARLDLVTPDVILLDALMPGLDGFETCRRIKVHPAWSHIPVIFMTGLSETSHIVRAFEAGGVDYVVKPVRTAEVLARLATHVRNARAVRQARAAIDVGGHGVLMVDTHGRLAWRSPQAQAWIAEFFPAGTGRGLHRLARRRTRRWAVPAHRGRSDPGGAMPGRGAGSVKPCGC